MLYTEVTGRLGADSELKTSKNGNQYVTMRIASNEYINGENVTTWVRILWPGERAVKKGSLVSVRGALRTSLYDNKNGEKAIAIDIFADRVDFVSSGSGATQSNDSVSETGTFKKQEPQTVAAPSVETTSSASNDDDLPF